MFVCGRPHNCYALFILNIFSRNNPDFHGAIFMFPTSIALLYRHKENIRGGGKLFTSSLNTVCAQKSAVERDGGGLSNASTTHQHPISKLIRGYISFKDDVTDILLLSVSFMITEKQVY
jgi:hypothetical protein